MTKRDKKCTLQYEKQPRDGKKTTAKNRQYKYTLSTQKGAKELEKPTRKRKTQ